MSETTLVNGGTDILREAWTFSCSRTLTCAGVHTNTATGTNTQTGLAVSSNPAQATVVVV